MYDDCLAFVTHCPRRLAAKKMCRLPGTFLYSSKTRWSTPEVWNSDIYLSIRSTISS